MKNSESHHLKLGSKEQAHHFDLDSDDLIIHILLHDCPLQQCQLQISWCSHIHRCYNTLCDIKLMDQIPRMILKPKCALPALSNAELIYSITDRKLEINHIWQQTFGLETKFSFSDGYVIFKSNSSSFSLEYAKCCAII